ncbi:MAG TPA: prepilin-type N-terminal cleavage/methylation domain-containing protein [Thermoanaerobaculia bacterium]|nr:prepilin-type N-terminal cleavage/methylation domain-containing protein [Thermoanaerobaculia bacterium]
MKAQAGFTLVELLVSLVITMLALALAAQVLMESSQMLVDAAAEQADSAMPLVVARLRGDVRAAASFHVVGPALLLEGHPAGTVVYERAGEELRRTVLDGTGQILGSAPALRGVTGWSCIPVGPGLLAVTLAHRRSTLRRGPLPALPAQRGPKQEERSELFLVAPRGAGLGESW